MDYFVRQVALAMTAKFRLKFLKSHSFFIIFLAFLTPQIYAQQVDFYSKDVRKNGDLIETNSSILLFSDEYFIRANRGTFNQQSKDLELFDDISILRNENERFNACYAKVNLQTNEARFEDFFFADNDMEVWFASGTSDLNATHFISKSSKVSSCNVEDPDWQIRFSTGELEREDNYLHLYNARLYVKNTPIFYLPYLGFSLDTRRKTGLLIPEFELNNDDGFYYNQPLFIAPYDSWDLEYRQQIRTSRGLGGYGTFRFMDSPHSSGFVNGGVFRDRSSYQQEQGLKNQTHWGVELRYLRDKILKSLFDLGDNYQEALWIDGTYLNDVDYLSLETQNSRNLSSLVESDFSYFFASENNYFATYAKYYIDTTKLDNKDTLQEYPSFQYHRFLDGILRNFVQYSFDASFNNYYREVGIHANITNLTLPVSVHFGLFDDFLNFEFTERIYASFVNYVRNEKEHEHFYRNYNEFALYTELSKPYESFFHSIYFGANYVINGFKNGEITQNFLNFEDENEDLSLKAVQFFYNDEGEKKFKHRVNLGYDTDKFKLRDIKNLVQYFFTNSVSISNEATYSRDQERFTKSISSFEIALRKFNLNISHAYKYDVLEAVAQEKAVQKHNFFGMSADFTYNINWKFVAGAWFDTQRNELNAWEIGYTYQRKCWNYSILYKERIDPQLTSAGIRAKNKSGVYFTFNFYPIGGVKYDFSFQERMSDVSDLMGSSTTTPSTPSTPSTPGSP